MGMLWTWYRSPSEESQSPVPPARMILATCQQERALATRLFSEETAWVCQLPECHLGRACYSGNPVGRVCMNVFAGDLLYALFNGFASALWHGRNQQNWNVATAFYIQLGKFQRCVYHLMEALIYFFRKCFKMIILHHWYNTIPYLGLGDQLRHHLLQKFFW